jgi:site-specific DNA recombinase
MKAILIARVSTEEQRDAGNSLPAQVARLERYCKNKNLDIVQTCSFDESAYTDNRSEFDRIIDLILAHKEKIIVCCDKVDRLSRNVFDKRISVLYEKALNDELELHFISDGQIINSGISAVEKFQFSISLGLAKYYSDAISDNVRRAMEQKLRKGEWLSKAPYGYKNIRVDGVANIIVDEYAAHIVRQMFELYATNAYSMDLLIAKIKKDFGIKWLKGTLAQMLSNPFYHGVMIVKGKKYPHRYPPIISKSVFDQVQNVKGGFNKNRGKYGGLPYIYRGLIRCGDCGLTVTPEKHKQFVYYHCTQWNGNHNAKWWREDKITEKLAEIFDSMQIPENIIEQLTATLDNLHHDKIEFHNKEFDKLNREHKTTTKMLDNLYLDKLKGRITESEYDKFYQSLREQIDDVSIRLDQLQEAEDNYYMTAKYVLELTKHAYELFKSSEVEEKRHLIKLVLSNLRIEGENLLWDVQKPFDLIVNCSDRQLWSGWPDSN